MEISYNCDLCQNSGEYTIEIPLKQLKEDEIYMILTEHEPFGHLAVLHLGKNGHLYGTEIYPINDKKWIKKGFLSYKELRKQIPYPHLVQIFFGVLIKKSILLIGTDIISMWQVAKTISLVIPSNKIIILKGVNQSAEINLVFSIDFIENQQDYLNHQQSYVVYDLVSKKLLTAPFERTKELNAFLKKITKKQTNFYEKLQHVMASAFTCYDEMVHLIEKNDQLIMKNQLKKQLQDCNTVYFDLALDILFYRRHDLYKKIGTLTRRLEKLFE